MPTNPLGAVFNVVGKPTDIHIQMRYGQSITIQAYSADGDHVVTLKESVDGSNEQALPIIDSVWKAPGAGGTWTEVIQTAADTYTHADGTNNASVFTVHASQLSDGFNCVEFTTTDTLWAHAILHGLNYPSDPTSLAAVKAA